MKQANLFWSRKLQLTSWGLLLFVDPVMGSKHVVPAILPGCPPPRPVSPRSPCHLTLASFALIWIAAPAEHGLCAVAVQSAKPPTLVCFERQKSALSGLVQLLIPQVNPPNRCSSRPMVGFTGPCRQPHRTWQSDRPLTGQIRRGPLHLLLFSPTVKRSATRRHPRKKHQSVSFHVDCDWGTLIGPSAGGMAFVLLPTANSCFMATTVPFPLPYLNI